jgi:glucokinase
MPLTSGPPPLHTTSTSPDSFLLGVDIGGTKMEAIVVDGRQQVLSQVIRPTQTENSQRLLNGVVEIIQAALHKSELGASDLAAVGIGIPGQVDPHSGEVRLAVNLNLTTYPLGPVLSTRFGVPVYMENDVRLAAVAAYHYQNQRQPLHHLAYLSVGTGIAAGVVLNGRLYRGASGMAGEIGHIVVDPQGPICSCGQQGCLESLASGPAVINRVNQLLGQAAGEKQNGRIFTSAGDVYQAAANGQAVARTVVNQTSSHLARAIQWLIMTYDVEQVVLGGGVTHIGQPFLQPLLHQLSRLRSQSQLARTMLQSHKVTQLPSSYNAGVWGAILLAQQSSSFVVEGDRETLRPTPAHPIQ